MTRMWSAYSSRSIAVSTELSVIDSSSEISRSRLVGTTPVDGDVEVDQGAKVAALVEDAGDEHVHRVPVATSPVTGMSGMTTMPSISSRSSSERLSSGTQMKSPKG